MDTTQQREMRPSDEQVGGEWPSDEVENHEHDFLGFEEGGVNSPLPTLPPPFTPQPSSATMRPVNQEIQQLIHFIQVTRIANEERWRQDLLHLEQQMQLNNTCVM